ncbi:MULTISPECIES: T9SS type B sorting domain-containing protein [unclassified Tenacibaculum]|uniref:T9SS type B sorting domain-containing protein n=1 Tax=unclassified Tenacibaculum TaxID=2635139 RepID=UPI001F24F7C4|nr:MULTISPECIES: T9SS type B sorting domain-containing protein [unclassified Tenacibaculum]MCF2874350.1 T9SS type B sorting domain-containing protein [Tenacibaculum sp. Cn5-1]MCF2934931.1 T9SS type B sorting domain-containing protein [Tenacibaculum sp. Cn5-34]MCG7511141.1 T9SS type B sorting domain-containing protein [Tenacibaculum sp. Cn5-46]
MKKVIITFFLLTSLITSAQNEANIWYFGRNAGIDFGAGDPTALLNGQLNTFEGCSTISDTNGNLLFYSDGTTVWDRNHNVMPNGTNLLGNSSSTQSALIVPNPTINNIYYLFTVDAQENNMHGVNYSIVDMNLNGGNGDITTKNTPLVSTATEKITAVIGKSCDAIWVITADTTDFYAYEVTTAGVNTTPVQSSLINTLGAMFSRGYLKASPDGTKLAMATAESGTYIYELDTNTGIITNGRRLDLDLNDGYGVEFSITGNKLYVSTGISSNGGTANLYQFDVSSPDINDINDSRGTPFYTYQGSRGALQIGPNGKIYHAVNRQNFLGVINSPENPKNAINYVHNGVNLNGRESSQGLPPFIQSYFLPTTILNAANDLVISNEKQFFCSGRDYDLKAGRIEPGATYTWVKDGNVIGTNSILTTNDVNFGPGIYELTIELNDACNTTLTADADIEFVSQPTVVSIPDFEQCDNDSNPSDQTTTFDLTSKEAELTNNATNVTVDFFDQTDVNFLNPLPKTNYINTTNPETIVVRVSFNSSNNNNCFATGSLTLRVINSNSTSNLADVYVCETDLNANNQNATNSQGSGNGYYDFSKKINEITTLNTSVSINTHTINFYRTFNDANNNINALIPPYENHLFTNNSDVYVRITPNSASSCFTIANFKIFIESIPVPKGNPSPILLCLSVPKENTPTTTVDLDASTGNALDSYQWYRNGELIPNATNSIYKASDAGTYKVEAFTNNSLTEAPCSGYNTFTVTTSSKALIVNIVPIDDTLNDNSITITVEGDGNYEYALNNSNSYNTGIENLTYTFSNLAIGIYTISIRDKNGCGITNSDEIPIIFFQKHCTPNQDGIYDTWKILGIDNDFFQSVSVNIYNRYGKRVAVIPSKNHKGWGGIYNGKQLPSTDYWYHATLVDKYGKTRIKKSHFALLRK